MRNFTFIILCLGWWACAAAETATKSGISAAGRAKIERNLKILDENIRDTENNIAASKKNILTLEAEMRDLDRLEKEHTDLKRRYENYVTSARQEIEKNEKALDELRKYEEKLSVLAKKRTITAEQSADLEKARRERMGREHWKAESLKKIQKISELEKKLVRNISSIESRRAPLRVQRLSWIDKQKKYESLISEIQIKKAETQKMLQ